MQAKNREISPLGREEGYGGNICTQVDSLLSELTEYLTKSYNYKALR